MKKQKHFLSLTICMVLLLSCHHGTAQDSYLKDRWTIKISAKPEKIGTTVFTEYSSPYILGNVGYGLFNSIEIGASVGISFIQMRLKEPLDQEFGNNYRSTHGNDHPIAELFVNFHPLTYLFQEKEPRFDLYLSARVGGIYVSDKHVHSGLYDYVQLGGGLSVYATKRIGIFSEYNHELNDFWNTVKIPGWRFGLTVKF